MRSLRIDLDGDGCAERLARFEYASMAGCGGYSKWVSKLAEDGASIEHGPLDSVFDKLDGGSVEAYEIDGRVYFEVDGARLYDIASGQLEQVCSFGERRTSRVAKVFVPLQTDDDVAP